MGRWFLCACLGLFLNTVSLALPTQFGFRITFRDKAGTANINAPLTFLSQKSLDRRVKYGIPVDSSDLPVSPDYLDSVKTISNGIIHTRSKWLNNCVILVDDSSTIQQIRTRPFVKSVEWVGHFASGLHNKPAQTPEDKWANETKLTGFPVAKPTGAPSYYGATWDQTQLVKGDCLHDKNWKGQGILIAVFDNGFNYVNSGPAFDSLYTSGRIVDAHNFAKDTTHIYGYGSHGTEVLSVMAGYLPNTYVGAAPLADYALYITEDVDFEQPVEMDNLVAGFERADSIGTDVMSMSVGYNTFNTPFATITPAELDGKTVGVTIASNMAMSKGIAMVVTAGNEGTGGLLTPGDADSVITVGNVDNSKVPAGSSGYGPNASGTIKPNVCGSGNPGAVMTWDMNIAFVSGTSISTPSIAGFTACLLQGNPAINPYRLRNAIQQTGHTYSSPGAQLGYGVPDFCAASQSVGVDDVNPSHNTVTSVYPSPFSDELNISIRSSQKDKSTISLYDITGKLLVRSHYLLQPGMNDLSLQVSSISSGVYFLQIQTRKGSETLKLIRE